MTHCPVFIQLWSERPESKSCLKGIETIVSPIHTNSSFPAMQVDEFAYLILYAHINDYRDFCGNEQNKRVTRPKNKYTNRLRYHVK